MIGDELTLICRFSTSFVNLKNKYNISLLSMYKISIFNFETYSVRDGMYSEIIFICYHILIYSHAQSPCDFSLFIKVKDL